MWTATWKAKHTSTQDPGGLDNSSRVSARRGLPGTQRCQPSDCLSLQTPNQTRASNMGNAGVDGASRIRTLSPTKGQWGSLLVGVDWIQHIMGTWSSERGTWSSEHGTDPAFSSLAPSSFWSVLAEPIWPLLDWNQNWNHQWNQNLVVAFCSGERNEKPEREDKCACVYLYFWIIRMILNFSILSLV